MSGSVVEAAVAAFESVLQSKNSKETAQAYNGWAEKFDEDSSLDGFVVIPKEVARLCVKYVRNSQEITLLDVGAGTGRVANFLRTSENFKGIIDILDGSMNMLCEAHNKDLDLRCIIRHLVDGDLPLPEQSYDVVVSSGAFLPNHLPVKTVEACVKLLKPSGFFILNDEPTADKAYSDQLQTFLGKLVQAKRISLLESFEITAEAGFVFNLYVYQRPARK